MTTLLVTSITAMFLQSTLFTEYVWPNLKAAYAYLLRAVDAFAEARIRNGERAAETINSSNKGRGLSARKQEGPR